MDVRRRRRRRKGWDMMMMWIDGREAVVALVVLWCEYFREAE